VISLLADVQFDFLHYACMQLRTIQSTLFGRCGSFHISNTVQ